MSLSFHSDSLDATSAALFQGEILIKTGMLSTDGLPTHSLWGGAVTAQMYLPKTRSHVWQQITNYPLWVDYFPDLIRSEVLPIASSGYKRLYQVAQKAFLFLSVQVEIYLNVFEVVQQQISFRLEKGTFSDFSAELKLQDAGAGTVLTYSVQATPTIPVPSIFIEQAMKLDLPANMRTMRDCICAS